MTPRAKEILTLAAVRGISITLGQGGDTIRLRGSRKTLAELQPQVAAHKPDLLRLLRDPQTEVSRAWAAAYDRLGVGYPEDGRDTLKGLAPELLAVWDEAEEAAEAASLAYIADETRRADFNERLAIWEAAVAKAVRYLTTRCHTCQEETTVTLVTEYGARTCSKCLQKARVAIPAKTKPPENPRLPPSQTDIFHSRS